jgi:hypothetical protein
MNKQQIEQSFQAIFKVPLHRFWHPFWGFDVVRFDEQFIQAPDGRSTRDVVLERYGQAGVNLIDEILAFEKASGSVLGRIDFVQEVQSG